METTNGRPSSEWHWMRTVHKALAYWTRVLRTSPDESHRAMARMQIPKLKGEYDEAYHLWAETVGLEEST